jgi:hypothetical protein
MKKRFVALCLLSATVGFADQDSQPEPPSNLFFDTDVYVYEPKFSINFGARALTGAKSSFSGMGIITDTAQSIGDTTSTNVARVYHDGVVGLDSRTVVVDDGNGSSTSQPITPDGMTNTWGFGQASQIQADGSIALHSYSATVSDGGPRSKNPGTSAGIELTVTRDMGRLTPHLKFDWNVAAGLSLNDLRSKLTSAEKATITTVTDVYSLNGAPTPAPPYSGPATSTVNLVDSSGNPVLNADGTQQIVTVNSPLLANTPQSRTTTTSVDSVSVTNSYFLKGAFYTFRAGPTIVFPVTDSLRATLSIGGVIVYSGSTFTVEQDFTPATDADIISVVSNTKSRLLPGYYVDAGMEYWMSARTGFYMGAVYQNSGDYLQTINTDTTSYLTKVDLSSLQGFRFGVNFKF